jgi:serine/threonine protein kinase
MARLLEVYVSDESPISYRAHGALVAENICREIMYQLCHALASLHALGITHRDLKPEASTIPISPMITATVHPEYSPTRRPHERRYSLHQSGRLWIGSVPRGDEGLIPLLILFLST